MDENTPVTKYLAFRLDGVRDQLPVAVQSELNNHDTIDGIPVEEYNEISQLATDFVLYTARDIRVQLMVQPEDYEAVQSKIDQVWEQGPPKVTVMLQEDYNEMSQDLLDSKPHDHTIAVFDTLDEMADYMIAREGPTAAGIPEYRKYALQKLIEEKSGGEMDMSELA